MQTRVHAVLFVYYLRSLLQACATRLLVEGGAPAPPGTEGAWGEAAKLWAAAGSTANPRNPLQFDIIEGRRNSVGGGGST